MADKFYASLCERSAPTYGIYGAPESSENNCVAMKAVHSRFTEDTEYDAAASASHYNLVHGNSHTVGQSEWWFDPEIHKRGTWQNFDCGEAKPFMCEFDIVDGTQDWHLDPSGSVRTKVGEEEMCLDSSGPPPPPPPPCVSLPDKTFNGYQSPAGGVNFNKGVNNVVWDEVDFAVAMLTALKRDDYFTIRTTATSSCSYDIEFGFVGLPLRNPAAVRVVVPGTGVPFDVDGARTTTLETSGPLFGTSDAGDLLLRFANTHQTGDDMCTVSFASTTVCKISHLPDGCVSLKSEWSSEVDINYMTGTDIASKQALAHLGVADLFKVNDIATVRGRISVRGQSNNWACTSGTFGFNMNGGSLDVSVHHNTDTGDSGSDFVDVVVTDEMTYLVTASNGYKWGVIGSVAGGAVNCKVEVEDMTICRPGHELKVAPCEYAEADSLSLLQCDGSPTT